MNDTAFKYFTTTLTDDEARTLRKKLARQYHPDVVGDDGATMRDINTEYEAWVKWKANPPILVPAPTTWADPTAWWSAITKATQRQAAERPDTVRRQPPPPPPVPSPPPRRAAPPPAPAAPQRRAARPASQGMPASQREDHDYSQAATALPDSHGHRVFGIVTILYNSYFTGLTVEAVEIRGSHPRHQIRENGVVVFERPATRAWQAERRDLISRANTRNYF